MNISNELTDADLQEEEERLGAIGKAAIRKLLGPRYMSNEFSSLSIMCQVPGDIAAMWLTKLFSTGRCD